MEKEETSPLETDPKTALHNTTLLSNFNHTLPPNKRCGILLKQGVTLSNLMTLYFLTFFLSLGFSMASSFATILIQDREYYLLS